MTSAQVNNYQQQHKIFNKGFYASLNLLHDGLTSIVWTFFDQGSRARVRKRVRYEVCTWIRPHYIYGLTEHVIKFLFTTYVSKNLPVVFVSIVLNCFYPWINYQDNVHVTSIKRAWSMLKLWLFEIRFLSPYKWIEKKRKEWNGIEYNIIK